VGRSIVRSTIVTIGKAGVRTFYDRPIQKLCYRPIVRSTIVGNGKSCETGSRTIVRSTIVTSGKPCDRATDHSWSRTIVRSTIVPQGNAGPVDPRTRRLPAPTTPTLRTPWFKTPVVPPPFEPYARYIATPCVWRASVGTLKERSAVTADRPSPLTPFTGPRPSVLLGPGPPWSRPLRTARAEYRDSGITRHRTR
jgi:hypothetical protein